MSGQCAECKPVPNVIKAEGGPFTLRPEQGPSPLPVGDRERKALPILTFLCEYFPDVIVALTELCVQGNIQHNPELAPTDIKWSREKSADQLNTAFRHIFERKLGIKFDADGKLHALKGAWRCMAQAQLDIEAARGHAEAPPEEATTRVNDIRGTVRL
jgi:hypothetical protein